MAEVEDAAYREPTFPCKLCGRHFIRSSLDKHEPACKKLTKAHRKVFDSGKQRADGSDIPLQDIRRAQKEKEKHGGTFPRPTTHWRERHEEFIGAVSASKEVDKALKTGGPLPPPPASAVPRDYVKCQWCGRNFSQLAADRHMSFCKEQHSRKPTAAAIGGGGGGGKAPATAAPGAKAPKTAAKLNVTGAPTTRQSNGTHTSSGSPPKTTTSQRANRPPSRHSSKDRPLVMAGSANAQPQLSGSGMTIGGAMIGNGANGANVSRRSIDAGNGNGAKRTPSQSAQRSNLPMPKCGSLNEYEGKWKGALGAAATQLRATHQMW